MTRIPSRKNPIHHENAPIVLPHDAALSPLSRSQDTIPRGLGFVLAAAVAALPISSEVAPLRRPPDPGSASPFVSSVAIKQSPAPPPAFPLRRRRPIQFVSGAAGRTAPSFVFNPLPPSREPAPTDAQDVGYEADQVDAGHRPTKYLTPAGYKGLMKEFHAQTGRNYEKKQFKNRWDDMKTIYCAWVFYKNKATGLGWDDVTQTVTADDAQWDAMIKVHKAIRAFRKGPPDNVKQLLMMFGGANVDGLSSVMPGVDDDYEEEEEEEEQAQGEPPVETEQEVIELYDEENEPPAPVQPKAKRKKASTIPCSPSKPKKNNVPKDFKRFVDHVIQEDRAGQTSKNTDNDDILAIMEEVAKCGASETSDEYYIATKLFAKPSNRSFFYAMKTTEGRLNWLKRQFEDRKK